MKNGNGSNRYRLFCLLLAAFRSTRPADAADGTYYVTNDMGTVTRSGLNGNTDSQDGVTVISVQ